MLYLLFQHSIPIPWLVSFALAVLVVLTVLRKLYVRRSIYTLGGKNAPKIVTFLPFGLDFMYQSFQATRQYRNLELWRSLFSKYGTEDSPYTVETQVGGTRAIITADHSVIQAVLATQFAAFGKGPIFHSQFREFLGDSVFTTDGQAWHESRQMVRQVFVRQRVQDMDLFERHTNTLMSLIKENDEVTNLTNIFYCYTLDVATDFLFGQTVGSMTKPQSEFAQAISNVQNTQAELARSGAFHSIIPHKGYREGIKVLESYIEPYITQTLALPAKPDLLDETTQDNKNFLSVLAQSTRSPKVIRDEVINLLFASRDTTAVTLMWLFYELAAKPAVVHRLRTEILSVLGPDNLPTPQDLQGMKFLNQIINETLRLYPAVPINVRYALRDTVVWTSCDHGKGRPISIRKGDAIAYSALMMQRRDDIYPPSSVSFPSADVFAPERWDHWTPKPWTYIPFNGGPRICVGQQFALMEIRYTVARLLQKFDSVERAEGDDGFQAIKAELVGSPARDVRVRFRETNSS